MKARFKKLKWPSMSLSFKWELKVTKKSRDWKTILLENWYKYPIHELELIKESWWKRIKKLEIDWWFKIWDKVKLKKWLENGKQYWWIIFFDWMRFPWYREIESIDPIDNSIFINNYWYSFQILELVTNEESIEKETKKLIEKNNKLEKETKELIEKNNKLEKEIELFKSRKYILENKNKIVEEEKEYINKKYIDEIKNSSEFKRLFLYSFGWLIISLVIVILWTL